jgi:hypothetical protein
MEPLAQSLKWLDRRLVSLSRLSEKVEADYVERRSAVPKLDRDHVLYDMDILDSKTSSLLGHVSIMLVIVTGLLVSVDDVPVLQHLLAAELFCYAIAALMLLRAVDVMGGPLRLPPEVPQRASHRYRLEMLIRRAIYQYMLRFVALLTIALIPILGINTGMIFVS